jgi:hypothetical protein
MAAWLAGLVLFTATTRPFPTLELLGGSVLAVAAGVLLVRSNGRSARFTRYFAWVNSIGGLLFSAAFAPDMFVGAWLAGVCAFGLLVAVEKVVWVQTRQV